MRLCKDAVVLPRICLATLVYICLVAPGNKAAVSRGLNGQNIRGRFMGIWQGKWTMMAVWSGRIDLFTLRVSE